MSHSNDAQADYWNSAAGREWIIRETALNAALATILERLLQRTDIRPGNSVLDIGCGTGAITLAAAIATGPAGRVTGLDIATQLLDRARQRSDQAGLQNTDFILADAQTYAFAPESYDVILSRFGVMFFADPVAAFANIATSLKPGGRMVFAAWGSAAENPWFSIPSDAAVARLGRPPPTDLCVPGPLAFQDVERVTKLLKDAGLSNVRGQAEMVGLTPRGNAKDAAEVASRVGPAARIMKAFSGTETDAVAIEAAVAKAFEVFETLQGISIDVAINFFAAQRAHPDGRASI